MQMRTLQDSLNVVHARTDLAIHTTRYLSMKVSKLLVALPINCLRNSPEAISTLNSINCSLMSAQQSAEKRILSVIVEYWLF